MSIANKLRQVANVIRSECDAPNSRLEAELLARHVDWLAEKVQIMEDHPVPASARTGLSVVHVDWPNG